ncbi:MAG TPA: hypothetical protein VN081_02940 [Dongiaceae bacterium]|nr:hypothetical protein [Dongiaceae bacterium]
MTVFNYLQLQPIDPQDDGTVSDFDEYQQDETIDLSQDDDGEALTEAWSHIIERDASESTEALVGTGR